MMINSIDELIEAFGGASDLGRQLGITQEAVSNWKARGEIPSGWHLRLAVDAAAMGWQVDPIVWGFVGADAVRYREVIGKGALHA